MSAYRARGHPSCAIPPERPFEHRSDACPYGRLRETDGQSPGTPWETGEIRRGPAGTGTRFSPDRPGSRFPGVVRVLSGDCPALVPGVPPRSREIVSTALPEKARSRSRGALSLDRSGGLPGSAFGPLSGTRSGACPDHERPPDQFPAESPDAPDTDSAGFSTPLTRQAAGGPTTPAGDSVPGPRPGRSGIKRGRRNRGSGFRPDRRRERPARRRGTRRGRGCPAPTGRRRAREVRGAGGAAAREVREASGIEGAGEQVGAPLR
jgi:hypothetical protein